MGVLSRALRADVDASAPLRTEFTLGGEVAHVGAMPLTAADFDHVNTIVSEHASRNRIGYVSFQQDPTNFAGQIALLIRKTRMLGEDGELSDEKAFDVGDKPVLMRAGVETISTMFADLFRGDVSLKDEADLDDPVKN